MPFRRLALLLASSVTLAPAVLGQSPDPVLDRMKADIFYLAGEECQGRGSGSPGQAKAAEYVAKQFKAAGLQPAGKNGSFLQPYTVYGGARLGSPNTLTLTGPDGTRELKFGTDFSAVGLTATATGKGGVVFAGYGITTDAPKYDDYAGLDVKGKVVFVLRRTPRAEDEKNPFAPNTTQVASLASKVENAAKRGAAAVVFVNDRGYAGKTDELTEYRRSPFAAASKLPVLHAKRAVLESMLESVKQKLTDIEAGIDKETKPASVTFEKWTAEARTTVTRAETPATNVVAISPGSGPLADETVVIGAHYDHLGDGKQGGSLGGADSRGKIHWGADDNGSGTTGLIELARRVGGMKDRVGRRVLFIAFSGEELGLFGSDHYCKEPIFPLEKTAFMINMDMIGRVAKQRVGEVEKDRLVVYGLGTSDGLEKLVDDANAKPGFHLLKQPGGLGPSDQENFYKKKIPVLFFFSGTHPDYHRPTDTPDKINLDGMKKVVDMVETLTAHFATVPTKPNYIFLRTGWEDPTEKRAPRQPVSRLPKLGFVAENYDGEAKGVLVGEVVKDGAAEKAGIKAGDYIVKVAGKPVKDLAEYQKVVGGQKAGDEIEIELLRKTEKVTVKATLTP